MTTFRETLPLLLIAALVPVVLLPVTALAVAAGTTILVVAAATLARWVSADASPGSRAQRDHASPYAAMDHVQRW